MVHARAAVCVTAFVCVLVMVAAQRTEEAPVNLRAPTWYAFEALQSPHADSFTRFNEQEGGNITVAPIVVVRPTHESYVKWFDVATGPDLVTLFTHSMGSSMGEYLQENLEDVTDIVADEFGDDLLPSVVNVISAGGRHFAVPVFVQAYTCVYSKSFFGSLGLSAPTTWAEFVDICRLVEAAGTPCLSLGFTDVGRTVYFDYVMLRMHGSDVYSQFVDGNMSFTDDPRIREAFAKLSELVPFIRPINTPGLFDTSQPPPRLPDIGEFATRQVAMTCELYYTLRVVPLLGMPETDLGVFPFPDLDSTHVSDGMRADLGSHMSWGIPKNAVYKDQARDFIRHVASLAEQTTLAPIMSEFPVRRSLNSSVIGTKRQMYDVLRNVDHVLPRSSTLSGFPEVYRSWEALVVNFLWQDTPEAAMATLTELQSLENIRVSKVLGQTARVEFQPPAGTFTEPVAVTLSSRTPGSLILYTLDGSYPNATSNVFTSGIPLSVNGVSRIRAVAISSAGLAPSDPTNAEYTIAIPAPVQSNADDTNTGLILGIVLPILFVCCVLGVVAAIVIHRRKTVTYRLSSDSELVIPKDELSLGKSVGEGGFGTVYLSSWRSTPVAVKRMHQTELTGKQLREFVSEASLLLKLRHPHVLIFMGITLEPPSIVTEYMDRGSLYDVLHDGDTLIPPSMVFKWAHAMASGLLFLEHSRIVHGDFKSLNVLLDSTWNAKICDFGLSSVRGSAGVKQTGAVEASVPQSVNVGTLFWAAPELLQGTAEPSAATDAYALGITLWELATRSDVYPGQSPIAVVHEVTQGRRPYTGAVPEAMGALLPIMRALWEANPLARPSFAEVLDDVAALYSTQTLAFPSTADDPSGYVYCVHAVFSGLSEVLAPPVSASELEQVVALGTELSAMAWRASGTTVGRGLGWLTLAFHSPGSAVGFLHEFMGSMWRGRAACVVAAGEIGKTDDAAGVPTLGGPVMADIVDVWRLLFGTSRAAETGLDLLTEHSAGVCPSELAVACGVFALRELGDAIVQLATGLVMSPIDGVDSVVCICKPMFESLEADSTSMGLISMGSVHQGEPPRWLLSRHEVAAVVGLGTVSFIGSCSRVVCSTLGGESVVVKVLFKQTHDVEGLADIARVAADSATAARAARGLGVGPIAVCLDAPFIALVFPRYTHGSFGSVLTRSTVDGGAQIRALDRGAMLPQWNFLSAVAAMKDVTSCLALVHEALRTGHGSLRPNNILLRTDASGQNVVGAAVTDFALNAIKTNQGTMTMVPSAAYMSPESMRGQDATTAGDVFVIGSLLYEIVMEKRAFEGSNALEVGARLLSGTLPSVSELPKPVRDLIRRCWAQNPADRPTMREVAATIALW